MKFIEKIVATCLFRRAFVVVTVSLLVPASTLARSQEQPAQPPAIERPEAVGQYLLVSANGQELPALVSESATSRQEVIGGSISLEADGSFVWSTLYRHTVGGATETSESSGRGTYSQQGTRIIPKFEVGDGGCCEGTLEGETLTIRADVSMAYEKSPSP